MAKKNLVIVESPAKAKTIGKYLGKDYIVKASMGHLRDLPKSVIGIDLEHNFEPDYRPIRGKEALIKELKDAADQSATVFLATDPDREGEAISWHLQYLLGLDNKKAKRVTFNEITKNVVQESIAAPREIDRALVDAQQARRLLDRIVGYQLSPLLWKKVRRGLSAGRVQSVAMRLVDDREREIESFVPDEYWTLNATLLQEKSHQVFTAHYHGKDGKKREIKSRGDVDTIIRETKGETFTVKSVKRSDKKRSPAPPFTTSTLQQDASRKLNMTPRRTMAIAQQLYEGIDIAGKGTIGLITYMRTDSLRISEEALASAKDFILERYGKEYYPAATRRFKAKATAQDAHEAIRPSDVRLTPEEIKGDLTGEQYRLYRLIWSRFLASQMQNAIYDSVNVEIAAGAHRFTASAGSIKFNGYTAVYKETRDEDKEEEKEGRLPALTEGEEVLLQGFDDEQHFTAPPARYTDATLIREMEEKGIGRPSTYAPTVSTILDHEYVIKEGKYLRPSPLGRVVTELLKERFPDIVDTKFTTRMEQTLDTVEEGKTPWKQVLQEFYGPFSDELKQAEEALQGIHLKVPDEQSEETCDVCGRKMVVKSGRFGRFLACPGFPDCTFTKPLVIVMPGNCPKCGGRIMKRSGISKNSGNQYTYYCCEHRNSKPELSKCDFMTFDVPVKDNCPKCGQTMFKKSGKGYKRPFCINPTCENFTPEDQRGYYKKKSDDAETEKKTAVKKTAAKKTTKKTATKKTAAKKTGAKKKE